jgi:hypothetical protein
MAVFFSGSYLCAMQRIAGLDFKTPSSGFVETKRS